MDNLVMSLGDGFAKRKKIQAEIQTWINRLRLAGKEELSYTVKDIQEKVDKAFPGTKKEFNRSYTIEECRNKIKSLLEEDKELALRISLTNQKARAKLLDINGLEKSLTIPELLILKNDILPKFEEEASAIPVKQGGEEILETSENYTKFRTIKTLVHNSKEISKEGFQRDAQTIKGYDIKETTDYGYSERQINDIHDSLFSYSERLKEAINQANKTELVEL